MKSFYYCTDNACERIPIKILTQIISIKLKLNNPITTRAIVVNPKNVARRWHFVMVNCFKQDCDDLEDIRALPFLFHGISGVPPRAIFPTHALYHNNLDHQSTSRLYTWGMVPRDL
jgi:hypothetical protein